MHVLYIDDKTGEENTIAKYLMESGITTDCVFNYEDAMAHIGSDKTGPKQYNLVLAGYPSFVNDDNGSLNRLRKIYEQSIPIAIIAHENDTGNATKIADLINAPCIIKKPGYLSFLPENLRNMIMTAKQVINPREALNPDRNLFRSLIEKFSETIILFNEKNECTYISPFISTILGYEPEEKLGMLWKDIVHPDDNKTIEAHRQSVMANPGIPLDCSFRLKDKMGSWHWIEASTTNLFNDPDISAILSHCRDITERKHVEDELRFIKFALDSVSDEIIYTDPVGNIVYANEIACKCANLSFETLTKKTMFDMNPRLTPEEWENRWNMVKKIGSVIIDEVRENGEGTKIPLEVKTNHFEYEGQEYHCDFVRDITDRRAFETALKESEAKYRNVVENSLVGFYIIQDNRFVFVNQRFCQIHGYSAEEILGKINPLDSVHPDDKKIVDENIRKRVEGKTHHIEYEFRRTNKDGALLTLKVVGGTILYNGHPAAFGTLIDVTRERTLESQLRQAQKMEAIGALAGGIAHDFNNILTALTGYTSLIQMKMAKSDPLQTYVDQVLSASMKATNLTHSLLAFSRQGPVKLSPVDINTLIRDTQKLLWRLLTEDITIKTSLSNKNMTIMADATQIDQILFNLATNARDSMPNGGVLSIETEPVELDASFAEVHGFLSPGPYVLLSISDTGIGMDSKTKEHIFDPFFTTKGPGKGTGLGLSTVYGIIKQHNGHISVYSELGAGTSFHIYFPLVKRRKREGHAAAVKPGRGNEAILIAEDDSGVRSLMREILTEYGYRVIEAVDGEDAINKFCNNSGIDMLILDSVMPKKNGREAYEAIKTISPHTKALFTSGYTRDIVLDKGIEDKKLDFIPKPLSPTLLLEKVREILDRREE